MPKKEICITAGKTAGGIVRCIIDSVKKTGKAGEAIVEFTSSVVKSTTEVCKNLRSKVDNLCKRVSYSGKLAGWETKQKDIFVKIGEKIFSEKELKKVESTDKILHENEVKELFKNAKLYESEIQKIKDELATQKQKMDTIAIIKRAEQELKSEDPRVRRVAVRVLERVGTKEIIPIITRILDDSDVEVRQRAAEVMHRLVEKFKVTKKETETIGKDDSEHQEQDNQ